MFGIQDGVDSDEELRDPKNLEHLIEQIGAKEEDYTLNLEPEIQEILEHFKVIVIGTKEKRTAKRLRLTNHFMRQFFKYIRKEKQWASGIKPKIADDEHKKYYEDCLSRRH